MEVLEDWMAYSDHMLVTGKAGTGSHICLAHSSVTVPRSIPPHHTVRAQQAMRGHPPSPCFCLTVSKPPARGCFWAGPEGSQLRLFLCCQLIPGFAIKWKRADWIDRSVHQLRSMPGMALCCADPV